jgi:amidohydrolase
MIEEGALGDPVVDEIYGMHILPDITKGYIGLSEGPVMAQTSETDLIIEGKSAHGAMPHKGVDAVVAAAQLVGMLQSIITRSVDPYERALITVGKLTAGVRRNIIADKAVLECMIRTFSDDVYQTMKGRILAMLRGLETAYGVKTYWKDYVLYPVVDNHPYTTARVRLAAGPEICLPIMPMMIAEDFSYYQRAVPGTFFFLGSREEERDAPLHSDKFDFDEEILFTALRIYQNLATGGKEHV